MQVKLHWIFRTPVVLFGIKLELVTLLSLKYFFENEKFDANSKLLQSVFGICFNVTITTN